MIVGVLSASGPTDGSTRLLVIPFYFLFTLLIRLILFLGGLLLRLFMTLVLLVASLVVAVAESVLRRDGGWATKIFEIIPKLVDFGARGRWTSEPLAPRWSKTSLEGTLERVSNESSDESEPLGIRRFVGKVGDMVHCDAIVPGFEIRTSDDEVVRVELELGGVVVTSSTGSPVERATLTRDDPKWLSGETELAPCRIAPGTLVALAGGVWSETESGLGGGDDFRHAPRIRVLRGTTEEPLWVAFEDRP